MDRNTTGVIALAAARLVALLAEGVDRNIKVSYSDNLSRVALLAEGVDRNSPGLRNVTT